DLLSCRNVLIYLETDLQKRVLSLLHYALNPGGYLFLGISESSAAYPDLFKPINSHHILQRVERVRPPWIDFALPHGVLAGSTMPAAVKPPLAPHRAACAAFVQLVLQEYAPAGALVNASGQVLCVAGPTGRYLQPPVGMFSTNVLDVANAS